MKLKLLSLFFFSLCSSRYEQAVLSGRPAGVVVPPACVAGHHSEKEECSLMGRSGTTHLATVPQNGWEGIIWCVEIKLWATTTISSKFLRVADVFVVSQQVQMSLLSLFPFQLFWLVMSTTLWCCLLLDCPTGRSFFWTLLVPREMLDMSSSARRMKLCSVEPKPFSRTSVLCMRYAPGTLIRLVLTCPQKQLCTGKKWFTV